MSNDYERSKIEGAELAWKLFNPEGYARAKEAESKANAELLKSIPSVHPRCPECGSIMRVSDSMLHVVPIARCLTCGYSDYV